MSPGAGVAIGVIVPIVVIIMIAVIYKKRQSLKTSSSPSTLRSKTLITYGGARVPILEGGVLKFIDPFQNSRNARPPGGIVAQ